MKKLVLLIIMCFCFSSCALYKEVVVDKQIKTHWIEKGEPAPFKGILLNDYTYSELVKKLKRYKEFCTCPADIK